MARSLPEEIARSLADEMARSLPDEIARSLPDEIARSLPDEMARSPSMKITKDVRVEKSPGPVVSTIPDIAPTTNDDLNSIHSMDFDSTDSLTIYSDSDQDMDMELSSPATTHTRSMIEVNNDIMDVSRLFQDSEKKGPRVMTPKTIQEKYASATSRMKHLTSLPKFKKIRVILGSPPKTKAEEEEEEEKVVQQHNPQQHLSWRMQPRTISMFSLACPVSSCSYRFQTLQGLQEHVDKFPQKYFLWDEHMLHSTWNKLIGKPAEEVPAKMVVVKKRKKEFPKQVLSHASASSYRLECEVDGCNYRFFSLRSRVNHYKSFTEEYDLYSEHKYFGDKNGDGSIFDEEDREAIRSMILSQGLLEEKFVVGQRRVRGPHQDISKRTLEKYTLKCQVPGCDYKFYSKLSRAKHYVLYSSAYRLYDEHNAFVKEAQGKVVGVVEEKEMRPKQLSSKANNNNNKVEEAPSSNLRMVQSQTGEIFIANILKDVGDARIVFTGETIVFQEGLDIRMVKCQTSDNKIVYAFDPPCIAVFKGLSMDRSEVDLSMQREEVCEGRKERAHPRILGMSWGYLGYLRMMWILFLPIVDILDHPLVME
jgi:hypothetical protein